MGGINTPVGQSLIVVVDLQAFNTASGLVDEGDRGAKRGWYIQIDCIGGLADWLPAILNHLGYNPFAQFQVKEEGIAVGIGDGLARRAGAVFAYQVDHPVCQRAALIIYLLGGNAGCVELFIDQNNPLTGIRLAG